jgi:hypothetical protein
MFSSVFIAEWLGAAVRQEQGVGLWIARELLTAGRGRVSVAIRPAAVPRLRSSSRLRRIATTAGIGV